jgi:hypothetical protein
MGEVIGVTTSSIREGQNLNFAVPSNYIRQLLADATSSSPRGSVVDSTPETWKSLSGTDDRFEVRRLDGRIYIERRFAVPVKPGTFDRCDLNRAPDGTWSGRCFFGAFGNCDGKEKFCVLEHGLRIRSLDHFRIEGTYDHFVAMDCQTCKVGTESREFVWVREH